MDDPASSPAARPAALPVLDIGLRPSIALMRVVSTLHVLALALLPFAMQPGLSMAALATGIAASWVLLRRNPVFGFGNKALRRLMFHADGTVSVHEQGGQTHTAQLLGSSLHTRPLILLRFALADGGLRTRAIGGDELEAELLRRLRVRLGLFKPAAWSRW